MCEETPCPCDGTQTCSLAPPVLIFRHGGRECAAYLHTRLHHSFRKQLTLLTGRLGLSTSVYRAVYDALFRAFIHTDRQILYQQEDQNRRVGPGCAAIVVVILGDTLWAANAGDARAVLCRDGIAVALSSDHKPVRGNIALVEHSDRVCAVPPMCVLIPLYVTPLQTLDSRR